MMEFGDDIEELKELVKHYKFASESFEKRVLDLQQELSKKDEEIKMWKDKYETGLSVKKDASFQNLDEGEEPLSMRKLFVGGLPQEATGESLVEYFTCFGTVQEATVVKDNVTHKSRGFGFVVFTNGYMTDLAQSSRPHKILNKEVDTKRAIPKSTLDAGMLLKNPAIQSRRVFIGGLRHSTTSEVIKEYFNKFGSVVTVDLIEDLTNGKSRGFAYVTFTDSDSTDKVIVQKYHSIDSRKCEAKPAFHKMPKPGYHDQHQPPFNPNYNDFQALFGAFQQQQQYYGGGGGGGGACQHKGNGDEKCFHCDKTADVTDPHNAWDSTNATAAAAANAYMNLDPNYQNQYRNFYNNNNFNNNNIPNNAYNKNFKNKQQLAYFQKPKPY